MSSVPPPTPPNKAANKMTPVTATGMPMTVNCTNRRRFWVTSNSFRSPSESASKRADGMVEATTAGAGSESGFAAEPECSGGLDEGWNTVVSSSKSDARGALRSEAGRGSAGTAVTASSLIFEASAGSGFVTTSGRCGNVETLFGFRFGGGMEGALPPASFSTIGPKPAMHSRNANGPSPASSPAAMHPATSEHRIRRSSGSFRRHRSNAVVTNAGISPRKVRSGSTCRSDKPRSKSYSDNPSGVAHRPVSSSQTTSAAAYASDRSVASPPRTCSGAT